MFKKKLVTILIISLLFFNSSGVSALAISIPTPPPAPTAPTSPTSPTPPSAPTGNSPTPPPAPTAPADPTPAPTPRPSNTPKPTSSPASTITPTSTASPNPTVAALQTTTEIPQLTGQQENGNTGVDSAINTGDANNTAGATTTGNQNLSATAGSGGTSGDGVTVSNTENGANSTNSGSVRIEESNDTSQVNTAAITNNLVQDSITGKNYSSRNTGGDSSITTGDANVTGTLITSVNTNVAGIMVSEFNIVDDHVGDILLDFDANCISGCGGNTSLLNSGNGTDSVNVLDVNLISNDNTFQSNDASVENNMVLNANSGQNDASRNTGGDSNITTGDANVSASALTFVNNNIAGQVIYGVVNIFGDLIGNIILPEGAFGINCCGSDLNINNSGNGSESQNTIAYDGIYADNYVQFNNLELDNTLYLDANTGGNEVSRNTNGNNSVTSGDASVNAQLLNFANNNLIGGDWWLVIVNEAGNWVGKIMGLPTGSWFGGSEGLNMTADAQGGVTVSNNNNGSGSVNEINVSEEHNNNITQVNNAVINNNMQLSANTGRNDASRNTGGDSNIVTGDANIIANIINFANNNIVGGGRLFVTVVNVFGSWLGDFVSPGSTPEVVATNSQNNNETQSLAVGGTSTSAPLSPSISMVAGDSDTNNTPKVLSTSHVFTPRSRVLAFANQQNDIEPAVEIVPTVNAFTGNAADSDEKASIKVNLAWGLPLGLIAGIGILMIRRYKHA